MNLPLLHTKQLSNFIGIFDITWILVDYLKTVTLTIHLNIYLQRGYPEFRGQLTETLSNSQAEIENGVAYKKSAYVSFGSYRHQPYKILG